MAQTQRFDVRYGVFRPLLTIVGAGPAVSGVDLDDDRLRVRMGWSFRADIPRRSIRSARPYHGLITSIGVHGWRGKWLVNGAARGVVRLEIDPPARAYVIGVPIRLRALRVSVTAPEDLVAALS